MMPTAEKNGAGWSTVINTAVLKCALFWPYQTLLQIYYIIFM